MLSCTCKAMHLHPDRRREQHVRASRMETRLKTSPLCSRIRRFTSVSNSSSLSQPPDLAALSLSISARGGAVDREGETMRHGDMVIRERQRHAHMQIHARGVCKFSGLVNGTEAHGARIYHIRRRRTRIHTHTHTQERARTHTRTHTHTTHTHPHRAQFGRCVKAWEGERQAVASASLLTTGQSSLALCALLGAHATARLPLRRSPKLQFVISDQGACDRRTCPGSGARKRAPWFPGAYVGTGGSLVAPTRRGEA